MKNLESAVIICEDSVLVQIELFLCKKLDCGRFGYLYYLGHNGENDAIRLRYGFENIHIEFDSYLNEAGAGIFL